MTIIPTSAIDHHVDATATFTGTRKENGVERKLSLAVACQVLGGGQADAMSNAGAASAASVWSLLVRADDWPDHLPPQPGDVIEIERRPKLRVKARPRLLDGDWVISCREEGGAT